LTFFSLQRNREGAFLEIKGRLSRKGKDFMLPFLPQAETA